jgi:hypothetical protein
MSAETTSAGTSVEETPRPTRPARRGRPGRRWGRLRILSSLLAILAIAAGVVLIRDAAVALDLVGGSMWSAEALEWLDGATREATWLWPAAVLILLLGLWFLAWALTAPKQDLVPVPGHAGLYVRTSGIEKLAVNAARDVPGVEECGAEASPGRVRVTTRTTGGEGIKDEVSQAVQNALGPLSDRCSVRVNTKGLHE